MTNPLFRILNRVLPPGVLPDEFDDEPKIKGVPRVPGNLPLVGNALSFVADGMHPDTTLTRWHDQFGPRYIANAPGQGTMLVTNDPNDIPPVARPNAPLVSKRDDPPFPWSEVWRAHPDRDLTYTWMSDQEYVDGIGVFKKALGTAEAAVPRFGRHMMWNINRLLSRMATRRNPTTSTIERVKALYFGFLVDPSIQMTCGKDLQFTLRDRSELDAGQERFYEAVLELGPNALEVARNPINHAYRTPAFQKCVGYWETLYGNAQRWYDEVKAARDLSGAWPDAVSRDKSLFLDGYEDYYQKNLCDERRLVCNIVEFVIGTADPGSQLMENILYQLAQHPEAQQVVYEEVAQVFGAEGAVDDVTLAQWDALPRLRAFIAETCRYMPLFTIHMRRTVEPTTLANGAVVPPGHKVLFNYAAMSASPLNYPEPERFMPERFLDLPELPAQRGPEPHGQCPFAAGKIHNVEAVVPFGVGHRACAGIGWAQAITGLAVASIVRQYKVTYDGPTDVPYHGSTPNHPAQPIDDFFHFEPRA